MVEDPYLKFTNDYLAWKRQHEIEYQKWTPEEFLEETILRDKAAAYDKIWDLLSEGNATIEQIREIVILANDTV